MIFDWRVGSPYAYDAVPEIDVSAVTVQMDLRRKIAYRKFVGLLAVLVVFPILDGEAETRRFNSSDGKLHVPGEHSVGAIEIFGDLGKSFRLPGNPEKKLWWERLARGEVGRDRFLILCALRDGKYKRLADIRDYVEFRIRETFPAMELEGLLIHMAGRMFSWEDNRSAKKMRSGEGWLQRNSEATPIGIDSQWRIAPNVLPLLHFLLATCVEDDRCQ